MNNDELQKAIDDITKDNAPDAAAPAVDAAAENEQLANELVGAAPAAPEVELAAAPAPAIPTEPSMPPTAEAPVEEAPIASAPEAPVAPAAPAPASAPEPLAEEVEEVPAPEIKLGNAQVDDIVPEAPEAPAARDDDTLNEALKELYPLLDRVDMPVEEKFDITLKFGEPAKALDLAKKITDETKKANALLEIVNKLK
ncbi:hypothetical protein IKG20_00165 [Candidatus Saccharibacteria bacterium]|nr:hypothetical protein [Candidatus Saccharibacteria bacterium]